MLHYDGQGKEKDNALRTGKEYGDVEFIADFRFPDGVDRKAGRLAFLLRQDRDAVVRFVATADGEFTLTAPGGSESRTTRPDLTPVGQWIRLHAHVRGQELAVTVGNAKGGGNSFGIGKGHWPAKGALVLQPEGAVDLANLFVRELK